MPPISVIKFLLFSDTQRCHSTLGNKLFPAAYHKVSPEAPELLSEPYIPVRINHRAFPHRIPPLLSDIPDRYRQFFLDGNKRIGTHAMLIFLELNGIELTYTQVELYQIIISVASGESDDKKLLEWLLNHET